MVRRDSWTRQISILPWRLPYPSSARLSEESVGTVKLWLQVTQTKNRIILSLCVLTGLDKTRRCIKTTIMIQGRTTNTRRTRQCPHRGHGMFEWAFKQSLMWEIKRYTNVASAPRSAVTPTCSLNNLIVLAYTTSIQDDSPLCVCFWIKQVNKLQTPLYEIYVNIAELDQQKFGHLSLKV